jgi:hypothetical protein
MIEDMTLRKLSPKTQSGYLRWVKRLNGFLKRSPATATAEDLRRFQLDLVERGVRRGSVNAADIAGGRQYDARALDCMKSSEALPQTDESWGRPRLIERSV